MPNRLKVFEMAWYDILNVIFGPIIWQGYEYLSIIVITAIVTFVITMFYRYLVDQNKIREIKQKQKEMQKEIEELQKVDPEEAKKKMSEMFKHTNEIMKMSFKPMILSIVIVVLFFPWMSSVFKGPVVYLPFSVPFLGNSLGWLWWYVVNSLMLTTIFRKMLGVE